MLKPEVKSLWVAALRSGKYRQGRGVLNSDGKFCCLGVLCEVLNIPSTMGDNAVFYGGQASFLPDSAMLLSGLTCPYGAAITIRDRVQSLVTHNDSGVTFAEIADAIETQL